MQNAEMVFALSLFCWFKFLLKRQWGLHYFQLCSELRLTILLSKLQWLSLKLKLSSFSWIHCFTLYLLYLLLYYFIMVALCNRADHYIFALWFLSFFSFSSSSSFFPRLISLVRDGCLPYFHTWCGLSANLECMSEMCCMQLAENTGRKKSPFWHHRTTLSGCNIFAAEAYIDNRKKLVKHRYLLHMSS